jgi:hypothetical protein
MNRNGSACLMGHATIQTDSHRSGNWESFGGWRYKKEEAVDSVISCKTPMKLSVM